MKRILLLSSLSASAIALIVSLFFSQEGILGARVVRQNWNSSALDARAEAGSFAASTTLFSLSSPFSATSTLDYFSYNQTGAATSSFLMNCGTSTSAYGTVVPPSDTLVDNIRIPTSTTRSFVAGSSTLAGFDSGTNSQSRIIVGANERVMCYASTYVPATDDDAFTNVSSTFEGTYSARWLKNNNQ